MAIIYHMLPVDVWKSHPADQAYVSDTLATEGFTHCTGQGEMLPVVANRFYRTVPGAFILLCIDEERVQAPVKWEAADDHLFPHIYGPLNRDAIVDVIDFPRKGDGTFLAPPSLAAEPG